MTSANVTHYSVFRGTECIIKTTQSHLCINRIDAILRAVEKPEECRLLIVWPDENEVNQVVFNGNLTEHIAHIDARDFALDKTRRHYKIMKENGTWYCMGYESDIIGKTFVSPDGATAKILDIDNGIITLLEDGWKKYDIAREPFALNWKVVK